MDPSATWIRVLTDPVGRVLDYGTTTYRPPRPLQDLVAARDRTCTFPGCQRPARQCQIDHVDPYPGGPTSAANNDAKCVREHNLKTAGLFTSARDPETGITTWTDRHGTRYIRPPELLPVDPARDEVLAEIACALATGRAEIGALRQGGNRPGRPRFDAGGDAESSGPLAEPNEDGDPPY